jgi:TonB-dependent receptor
MLGVSAIALSFGTLHAQAADSASAAADSAGAPNTVQEVVVTGIRASLEKSLTLKRTGQGVVDAITAEDIGKFPDTNLAESLQRITGVSIDRSNGEGSTVTVRGFGPDFNLVLLNGRQMPASGLGSCCEAPASRSFDFGNLASEGIAAVEVYKSGRATLPTGGIGSVINIRTPKPLDRPGFRGSLGIKTVDDTSRFQGSKLSPEVSGIVSDTFADGKFGVLLTGSYQNRKSSQAQFNAGWREGYLGNENNWGSLPVDANDWRGNFGQVTNHPKATDVYQVPQNAGYDFTDVERKRINGHLALQYKPSDNLSATVDYTFSQNTIKARTNSIGVWFNHANTTSSWTNGPAAGPNFYSEAFGQGENKDLAITGAVASNRSENRSLGGNLEWRGPGGLRVVLDAHHSTAVSSPTSPYGSNIAVGSAIYGVASQKVDFTHDMPVISVNMYPGSEISAANIRPAGNAFRNAYMRDQIDEISLKGSYDFDSSFIKSLDFGVTSTDNQVRSAYGFIQNDTWGGTLTAAQTPDGLYTPVGLSSRLDGMSGSNAAGIIPTYFGIKTEDLIKQLDSSLGICASAIQSGTCLAKYTADRRVREQTIAPYIQSLHSFSMAGLKTNLRLGLRYEETEIKSSALVPIPTGTLWTGDNEISIIYGSKQDFATLKGKYHNLLPAIDFDIDPMKNVKLRASYSHTLTRSDYASLQGGTTLDAPIRIGGSTGRSGNPALLPYKSKNIDLSAEWYYAPQSYVSVGYFHKDVSNFISNTTVTMPEFGLTNPATGAHVTAAKAALGAGATTQQIRTWIATNYPATAVAGTNNIYGQSGDPLVNFVITRPVNSDQQAALSGWEFAVQHNFADTGFGVILNYTIVDSDTKYDNTIRYTIPQFAVNGVSDSANAVLYYDKAGLQARVAYNWRDKFLSGYGTDPYYVEAYGQYDASASYKFGNGVTVFVEGINLTNEGRRGHERNSQSVFFAAPGYARYNMGVRYAF